MGRRFQMMFVEVPTTQGDMLLNLEEISTAKAVRDDCPDEGTTDRTWVMMKNGEGVRVTVSFQEFAAVIDMIGRSGSEDNPCSLPPIGSFPPPPYPSGGPRG